MKKYIYSISIIAALFAFGACNKVQPDDPVNPDPLPEPPVPTVEETIIGIQGEGSEDETKTYLSGGSVIWEASDAVEVFSDTNRDGVRFILKDGAGQNNARFTNRINPNEDPEPVAGSAFYIVYPYSESLSFDGRYFSLILPSDVEYVEGSFAHENNPSIGQVDDLTKSISMKNMCGLVRVALKGNVLVSKLKITLDKPICGEGTISTSSDELVVSSGSKTITIHANKMLNSATATNFYFVIPANNYSNIRLDVIDQAGVTTTVSSSSAFSVLRAKIKAFKATVPEGGNTGTLEELNELDVDDLGSVLEHPQVSVTSFNIKNQSDDDDASTSRDWNPTRREAVKAYINSVKPSILCTQECEYRQKEWLLTNCSGYAAYGRGSDHGKDESGEAGPWYDRYDKAKDAGNYIFYRTDKYEALATGTYWLSDTPESVSKYSSSNHYRCCSWVKFKDKSNNYEFYVFSTHLHQGYDSSDDSVRSRQLDVLYNYAVGTVNTQGLPMIICGDFNMTTTGSCLESFKNTNLMQFARNVWNKEWDDAHKSYNAWAGAGSAVSNIDHIMYKSFYKLDGFSTNISSYNGVQFMSDHYPISATLEFNYQN